MYLYKVENYVWKNESVWMNFIQNFKNEIEVGKDIQIFEWEGIIKKRTGHDR